MGRQRPGRTIRPNNGLPVATADEAPFLEKKRYLHVLEFTLSSYSPTGKRDDGPGPEIIQLASTGRHYRRGVNARTRRMGYDGSNSGLRLPTAVVDSVGIVPPQIKPTLSTGVREKFRE